MNALSEIVLRQPFMSQIEKKIADYIIKHSEAVINMTIKQMSAATCVSESSIINFAQSLGLSGYSELKINIAQNLSKSSFIKSDEKEELKTHIHSVVDTYITTCRLIKNIINPKDIDKIAEAILATKHHISLFGFGYTAPIALDSQYWLSSVGVPSVAHTESFDSLLSASMMLPGSVAIGFSQTGRSINVIKVMTLAKKNGAQTIAITQNYKSPLAKVCDIVLTTVSQQPNNSDQSMILSRAAMQIIFDIICITIKNKRKSDSIKRENVVAEIAGEFLL